MPDPNPQRGPRVEPQRVEPQHAGPGDHAAATPSPANLADGNSAVAEGDAAGDDGMDAVVDGLITALEELADKVTGNAEMLVAHDEHLGVLAQMVSRGHWDPGEPDTLEEWVDSLSDDYYLADELHGWQDNTAMRNELAALRVAWRRMISDQAGPWDALTWHEHLDRSRTRWPGHNARRRTQAQ